MNYKDWLEKYEEYRERAIEAFHFRNIIFEKNGVSKLPRSYNIDSVKFHPDEVEVVIEDADHYRYSFCFPPEVLSEEREKMEKSVKRKVERKLRERKRKKKKEKRKEGRRKAEKFAALKKELET